jgi:hypothetical protein
VQQTLMCRAVYGCVLAVLLLGAHVTASAQGERDAGESKEYVALRNRVAAPKATDIDSNVTLEALLSKKEATDWSTGKAAVIEGYVIQVEREEDGDRHIVLAANPGETDTTKWVIVEVTSAWSRRTASLSAANIRSLKGKHIRVTGWLYYEPDFPSEDPRGTRWELHPVTSITLLK